MLKARDLDPKEPIYTFVDNDGSNVHIASERLRKWTLTQKLETFLVPMNFKLAQRFLLDNVADPMRVIQLLAKKQLDPVIFCKTGTTTNGFPDVMLVDGHHRYVLAWKLQMHYIPAYTLEQHQWRPFEIEGCLDLTQEQLTAMPILPREY